MVSVRQVVYGLALMVVLQGCSWLSGTDVYVNTQYNIDPKPGVRLAIVPIPQLGPPLSCTGRCPSMEEVTDKSFTDFFERFSGEVQTFSMENARAFFKGNSTLWKNLIGLTFSNHDLQNDPSLRKIFSGEELALIREGLGSANLLLVPARFDLVPYRGNVSGQSEFRLYDLESGSMIFSSSRNLMVNQGDEIGRGIMAIVLISHIKSDFSKLYLKHEATAPAL